MNVEELMQRLSALSPSTRVYTRRDYTGELDRITEMSISTNEHDEVVVVLK